MRMNKGEQHPTYEQLVGATVDDLAKSFDEDYTEEVRDRAALQALVSAALAIAAAIREGNRGERHE